MDRTGNLITKLICKGRMKQFIYNICKIFEIIYLYIV
jgi:hypothetical protein